MVLRTACPCLTLVLAMVVGCGGPRGEHPTTPVTVTVSYQGQPVDGATVTFLNTHHENPVLSVGRTDASGVAKMRTYGEADGAIQGTHRVTILKSAVGESQADLADVETDDYDPDAADRASAGAKSLIPPKYGTPNSGLSVQVAGESLEVTFELED